LPSQKLNPLAVKYIRWTFLRAMLHRGWGLVTSLYFVVDAGLSPLQLIFLGTAQGIVVITFEIPTGVIADNYSRKWSLVISHVLMGTGMVATGLVNSFPALVLTQMLWGLSWTFSSGADVAWITDELDEPTEIGKILGIAARWEQLGSGVGIISFGALAWLTSLDTSIVIAGSFMLLLGCFVAITFVEKKFVRTTSREQSNFWTTLASGVNFARNDRTIILILSVTFLVNGADEVFLRLYAKGLVDIGLPTTVEPVVWLTALGLVTLAVGAITLRLIENRLRGQRSLWVLYLLGSLLGLIGILLFALAPNSLIGMSGVIVVHGIAWSVVRLVSVILINERADSRVRATLQSFLSQAENFGEVLIGLSLGFLAEIAGIPAAMIGAAIVVALATGLIAGKSRNK